MTKKIIIKYLIVFALAISIVVYLKNNRETLRALSILDFKFVFLLMLCIFLSFVVWSANLYTLLKVKHDNLVWGQWFEFHLMKRFLNMHMPQSGNVYEALKMKESYGIDIVNYASSFGAVNWFNACFNCVISLVLLVIWGDFSRLALLTMAGIVLILLALILGPLLSEYFLLRVDRKCISKKISAYMSKAHIIIRSMREEILNIQIFSRLLLWNFIFFWISLVMCFLGFKTLGFHMELKNLIPFVVLSTMGGIFNILPGNFGIMEYAFGFLGNAFHLTTATGILLSLLFRLAMYIVFLFSFLLFFSIATYKKHKVSKE